jgi:hypothetical protein
MVARSGTGWHETATSAQIHPTTNPIAVPVVTLIAYRPIDRAMSDPRRRHLPPGNRIYVKAFPTR